MAQESQTGAPVLKYLHSVGDMESSSKLRTYSLVKKSLCFESYMLHIVYVTHSWEPSQQ